MALSKKIVLDTNFLLIPYQFNVDIFTEFQRICDFNYKLHIMEGTLKELENIKKEQKGRQTQAVKLALELIKAKDINIISSAETYVDNAILNIADNQTIVATQDAELKKKLKKKGVGIITLKQKKFLSKG